MFLKLCTVGQGLWFETKSTVVTAERRMRQRARDERGATAIEYALLVALVALVIIVGLNALGSNVNEKFQDIGDDANLQP